MDRQKLLMIFGGAAVAAALLTWFLYSSTVAPKSEKLVQVLASSANLPAGTRLQKNHFKKITVAAKDVPPGVLQDEKAGIDRTLLYPLGLNEPVLASRLSSVSGADGVASLIEPGKRAVSVSVNDASSASGLIQARSHVDVLFTKPGSMLEAVTTTVLEDVVVLSVGRVVEPAAAPAPVPAGGTAAPPPVNTGQSRAVTLLVTPEQARILELAKNQGRVSLALRNPKDESKSDAPEPPSVTAEAIDPGGAYRSQRLKMQAQNRLRAVPNLRDDQAWAKLIGEDPDPNKPAAVPRPPEKKDPPKPKFVVDVFRGEKHVQESFQE
jgi:pilus assembly protein CpaB